MTFSLLNLFCFLLLICSNPVFAGPLPRSCKGNPQSTSASSSPPSPTTTTAATSTSTNSNATALSPVPSFVSPSSSASTSSGCFPSLNFQMPSSVPDSLDNWWCPMDTEYAFMGFSYEVTACWSSSSPSAYFKLTSPQARARASSIQNLPTSETTSMVGMSVSTARATILDSSACTLTDLISILFSNLNV